LLEEKLVSWALATKIVSDRNFTL